MAQQIVKIIIYAAIMLLVTSGLLSIMTAQAWFSIGITLGIFMGILNEICEEIQKHR